jgi:hypothetical protein
MTENTVTISVPELEAIIQRIVQTAVREELLRWFDAQNNAWFEFWTQEGEDDPAEEEEIVKDAVEILRQREVDKTGWKSLEEFEAELAAMSNELPR